MTQSLARSCPEFSDSESEPELEPELEQPKQRFRKNSSSPDMAPSSALTPAKALAFLKFVDASPTPFHAVHTTVSYLNQAGFKPISSRADLSSAFKSGDIVPGGKYYLTRNQSSLLAFVVPRRLTERTGFSVVAGHTDSPCLKVRPVSKREKAGYVMVNTETYGGGAWPTWFDRDLGLAGRVILKQGGSDQYVTKLIHIERPILRIPTLAIHLDRTINDAFKFNKETEFQPVLGLVNKELNSPAVSTESSVAEGKEADKATETSPSPSFASKHHSLLMQAVANELNVKPDDIFDFELSLFDTQKAAIGGINSEFIHTARLDNLMTCFCAVDGLIESVGKEELAAESDDQEHFRTIVLFDNEEVGSVSYQGAESDLLPSFMEQMTSIDKFIPANYGQVLQNSFLISCDMAHAVNPLYEARYQDQHKPHMNGGVVIKMNANQRYTSNPVTTFALRRLAEMSGVPIQEFEVRNDSSCGSTIGPALSVKGFRTVDIGIPQLSMHSIRETCGTKDPEYLIELFKTFFKHFSQVDAQLQVD
ncbi:hypothetical protein NliqN6_3110 [Naganishia liquefaciens]|uniref:aspartyl aminopeptidase n=1 Tax=Naganishia liquefaciens TaxID=104408 RepID=A0A8H3YEX7_9TREE|nr:hypothetical protein NliqN6_3110 [Naganishia liquefaciens]